MSMLGNILFVPSIIILWFYVPWLYNFANAVYPISKLLFYSTFWLSILWKIEDLINKENEDENN